MSKHRADTRAVSRRRTVDVANTGSKPARRPSAGSHRTQQTPADKRRTLPIPAMPTLVGLTALAIAVAGAVSVANAEHESPLTSGAARLSGQATVLSGSGSAGSSTSLSGRARAVSRDSAREAQQDAAEQDLQAAAERQAKARTAALASLAASAQKRATVIARNTWQLPVAPGVYHLTSRFGECSGLWSHCHTGLDFAAPSGSPIRAVAGGTVTSTSYEGAYGNQTIVTLDDGTEVWYCHQTSYTVSSGERVQPGQVIGSVGSTGNVTGPHLHIEVRPGGGDPVDPYAALAQHGLQP